MEYSKYFEQSANPFMMNTDFNYQNKKYEMNPSDKKKDDEIYRLNKYIQNMNYLIRKYFNMKRLPDLEEGLEKLSDTIKNPQDIPGYQKIISQWLNDLMNADYINPLITLYEKHIENLNKEVNKYKALSEKYEKQIRGLLNDNKELMDKLLTTEKELKKYMEVYLESGVDNFKINDKDYATKVEDRCRALAKENEILVVNYNKTLNELSQLKNKSGFAQSNNISQQYSKLFNDYDNLKKQFEMNKEKVNEISNNKNLLEKENLKLKNDLSKVEYELKTYKESNQRYENMLKNNY